MAKFIDRHAYITTEAFLKWTGAAGAAAVTGSQCPCSSCTGSC